MISPRCNSRRNTKCSIVARSKALRELAAAMIHDTGHDLPVHNTTRLLGFD